MANEPVAVGAQILMLVGEQTGDTGLGVNEIYRRTGNKNKPLIIKSIEYLERCQFIETRKSKHKQQKVKVMTNLGSEVAHLIDSINKYNVSYANLISKMEKHIVPGDVDENVRNCILLDKGWTAEEVNGYGFFLLTTRSIGYSVVSAFINAMLVRYVQILLEFNINLHARTFLNQTIINALEKQLTSVMMINSPDMRLQAITITKLMRTISLPVFASNIKTASLLNDGNYGYNVFPFTKRGLIDAETFDILRNIFAVLKPNVKTIPGGIDLDQLQGTISGLDLAEAKFEQHIVRYEGQPFATYKVDEEIPAMLNKYEHYKTQILGQTRYIYEINDDTSVHEDEKNKKVNS